MQDWELENLRIRLSSNSYNDAVVVLTEEVIRLHRIIRKIIETPTLKLELTKDDLLRELESNDT